MTETPGRPADGALNPGDLGGGGKIRPTYFNSNGTLGKVVDYLDIDGAPDIEDILNDLAILKAIVNELVPPVNYDGTTYMAFAPTQAELRVADVYTSPDAFSSNAQGLLSNDVTSQPTAEELQNSPQEFLGIAVPASEGEMFRVLWATHFSGELSRGRFIPRLGKTAHVVNILGTDYSIYVSDRLYYTALWFQLVPQHAAIPIT